MTIAAVALGLMALAIWQRSIAQANEAQAKAERDAALTTQSRFLVDQARQSYAQGDYGTALALALEALPDERRGRVRPYLPAAESMLYQAVTTLRERHAWELVSHEDAVKVLPDGKRLVTFSQIGNAGASAPRIRDAATGAVVAVLEGHTAGLVTVAVSPDGKQIVTASFDNTARLWRVADGAALGTFKGPETIRSAAFSPDGQRIVTGSSGGAQIWQAANDTAPLRVLATPEETVNTAEFSADGQSITTTSSTSAVPARWTRTPHAVIRSGPNLGCHRRPDLSRVVPGDAGRAW